MRNEKRNVSDPFGRPEDGDDLLLGGTGADRLYGGDGADQIAGDNGGYDTSGAADEIYGEAGNDIIDGQGGNDVIDGGGIEFRCKRRLKCRRWRDGDDACANGEWRAAA